MHGRGEEGGGGGKKGKSMMGKMGQKNETQTKTKNEDLGRIMI
jgi:hypothetical protein